MNLPDRNLPPVQHPQQLRRGEKIRGFHGFFQCVFFQCVQVAQENRARSALSTVRRFHDRLELPLVVFDPVTPGLGALARRFRTGRLCAPGQVAKHPAFLVHHAPPVIQKRHHENAAWSGPGSVPAPPAGRGGSDEGERGSGAALRGILRGAGPGRPGGTAWVAVATQGPVESSDPASPIPWGSDSEPRLPWRTRARGPCRSSGSGSDSSWTGTSPGPPWRRVFVPLAARAASRGRLPPGRALADAPGRRLEREHHGIRSQVLAAGGCTHDLHRVFPRGQTGRNAGDKGGCPLAGSRPEGSL